MREFKKRLREAERMAKHIFKHGLCAKVQRPDDGIIFKCETIKLIRKQQRQGCKLIRMKGKLDK